MHVLALIGTAVVVVIFFGLFLVIVGFCVVLLVALVLDLYEGIEEGLHTTLAAMQATLWQVWQRLRGDLDA
jgi:hypothetical protein